MQQPLTNGFGTGDSASQASSQSRSQLSGSLLDRIRAQQDRSREHQPAVEQQGQMIVGPATPSSISIPNYGPANGHNTSTAGLSELGSSSFLGGNGGFEGGGPEAGMGESLLGGSGQPHHNSQYSMTNYFQTFVMDVYGLFRTLHPVAQVALIIFLMYLVIKWI